MKLIQKSSRPLSGLLLAGAVLFQVTFLPAQAIPIAVVEFEANGISQTEAIALTDRLRNELFRLGAFEVVERGMMETILTEQDFQLTGCTSNECLVEVGQLLGARQVVGGRISRVGAMFTVSARVVDVQTGKLLGVSDFDLRGGLEEMLTRGMKQVAVRLSAYGVVIKEETPGETITTEPYVDEVAPQAEDVVEIATAEPSIPDMKESTYLEKQIIRDYWEALINPKTLKDKVIILAVGLAAWAAIVLYRIQ